MPDDGSNETPTRKMRKITRACDACKARKKACTGTLPCGPCVRRKLDCTFNAAYNRGAVVTPPPSTSYLPIEASPSVPSPVTQSLQENVRDGTGSTDVAHQYWGPTSAHSFLGRAVRDLPTPYTTIPTPLNESANPRSSIFSFGDRHAPEVDIADFTWPDRTTAETLIGRYFEFASPTYRILHQPTVEKSLDDLYEGQKKKQNAQIPVATEAIMLLVFGTASLFQAGLNGRMMDADDGGWRISELFYLQADQLLLKETGVPSLESAQARFLIVLYLMCSSRAHKAWFTLGTTIQLIMALGFHRRYPRQSLESSDVIQKECQRRILWCSYTLDKYISVILGQPRLWHDEDIDQALPSRANDEDLTKNNTKSPQRDCVMDAPIFHSLLAQTLAQAAKEPYAVAGVSSREHLHTIQNLCARVTAWQAELPPILSGMIHPSSLVPIFQRQLTVLQLARCHALMFITRPLLLRDYGQIWPDCQASYIHFLNMCLSAAREAIELILRFVRENQLFHAFWYSQFIAFNALSIIYIYLIQVKRGRLVMDTEGFQNPTSDIHRSALDESNLYKICETAQSHLANATARNAPSWRYSAILQCLRRELGRLEATPDDIDKRRSLHVHGSNRPDEGSQTAEPTLEGIRSAAVGDGRDENVEDFNSVFVTGEPSRIIQGDVRMESLLDNFGLDKDLMLDFWPQLDSLPLNNCS